MTERDLSDLENEENWDFDSAFVHQSSPTARGIISVPFEREEFERLAAYARQRGKTLTECVHDLVMQRVAEGLSDVSSDTPDVIHDPLD